jgi:hypothetical protein
VAVVSGCAQPALFNAMLPVTYRCFPLIFASDLLHTVVKGKPLWLLWIGRYTCGDLRCWYTGIATPLHRMFELQPAGFVADLNARVWNTRAHRKSNPLARTMPQEFFKVEGRELVVRDRTGHAMMCFISVLLWAMRG